LRRVSAQRGEAKVSKKVVRRIILIIVKPRPVVSACVDVVIATRAG